MLPGKDNSQSPDLLFIFSLPRSGSTLLQRILMGHPKIFSVSEPWLLLPLAYMLPTDSEVIAPYEHSHAQSAIRDMINASPHKEEDFYTATAQYVKDIYARLCPADTVYFIDKTPRYYLILPFIERLFPNAKFIFLFRNPIAMLASIMSSFSEGRFGGLHQSYADLYQGPRFLVEGWKRLQHKSLRIQYEDLVTASDVVLARIMTYLDLPSDEFDISRGFRHEFHGKMGDKSGLRYTYINSDSLDKWKSAYNTKFRRRFAKKYIEKIGNDILGEMGYSAIDVLSELYGSGPAKKLGIQDVSDYARVTIYRHLTSSIVRKAMRKVLIPSLRAWR